MSKPTVEVLLPNVAKMTGEGPHWDEETRTLLHVDIGSGDVHRWNYDTGDDETHHMGSTTSLVVPRQSGGYVVGHGCNLVHLDWNTKEVTTLAELDSGTKHRMNDGKCDASGRLWAGTMGDEPEPCQVELGKGTLYSLERDRSVRGHMNKLDISNGLAWTSDNRTMFFIDSIPKKVYQYDFDLEKGTATNERTFVDMDMGIPDGCCMDANNNLWVAAFSGHCVVCYDTTTGKVRDTIKMPTRSPTSCCFGGPNLDELFVTSCMRSITCEEKDNPECKLAGSVFRVRGLGVKGQSAGIKYQG